MAASGSLSTVIRSLDAIAKGAKFLQDMPEIETEFQELRKEIAFVEDLARGAQSAGGDAFSNTPQVDVAIQRLREINEHLQAIEQDCSKSSDGHMAKVKKGKWFAKSNKIEGLLQKAQEAKSNLSHALLLQERQQNNTMAIQVSQLYQILVATGQGLPPYSNRLLNEAGDTSSSTVEGTAQLSAPIHQVNDARQSNDDDAEDIPRQVTTSGSDLVQLPSSTVVYEFMRARELGTHERKKCPTDCRCRCHLQPWSFKNPSWFHPIFGSLSVSYHSAYDQEGQRWDYRCACNKEGNISVTFQPPNWLRRKTLFSQASYPLRCTLRPVRILPIDHHAWYHVSLPVEELQRLISEGEFYFPDDETPGGNLVEHMIEGQWYGALEFLLNIWADILPNTGLSRRVWYATNTARGMHYLDLTEQEARVLDRVEMYIEDKPASNYSRLHDAVYSSGKIDISRILQEEPETIDELDDGGDAALHHAAKHGRVEALQLLLDAGADVNCKDRNESTALILAAEENESESVRILLQAGSRINDQNNNGETALHCAVECGNLEAVYALLEQGASASIPDAWGYSPLHSLCWFGIHDEDSLATAEALVDVLLGADGCNINALSNRGHTPLSYAMEKNNQPIFQLLLNSGPSYNSLFGESCNLLHAAARWGRLECLTFLTELELGGIDTSLCDSGGWTPWDFFIHELISTDTRGYGRRPESAEVSAFVELYQGIRDRNLAHEISTLTQALEELLSSEGDEDGHGTGPCKHLDGLSKWKSEHHNSGVAAWYRALSSQIKHGSREGAVVEIEECLDDLRAEMGTSPWAQPNVQNITFTDETIAYWTGGLSSTETDVETLSTASSDACEEQPPSDGESSVYSANDGDSDDTRQ